MRIKRLQLSGQPLGGVTAELVRDATELNPGGDELGCEGVAQVLDRAMSVTRALQDSAPLAMSEVVRVNSVEHESVRSGLEAFATKIRERVPQAMREFDLAGTSLILQDFMHPLTCWYLPVDLIVGSISIYLFREQRVAGVRAGERRFSA